jgi:hypothetical protein
MPRKVSDVQDPSQTLTLADAHFSFHVADSATSGLFKPGDVIAVVNIQRKRHTSNRNYTAAVGDPRVKALLTELLEAADADDEWQSELRDAESGASNG